MAHYVQTEGQEDNSTENASALIEWLKANNLQQLIPTFKNENMTMEELLEYGQDPEELNHYLNLLNIPKASIARICFKIKKQIEAKNKSNQYNNNKINKIVKIVVSQDEEKEMQKLSEYSNNISLLIKRLSEKNDKIIENTKQIKSDINAQFNSFINLISNKQEMLLNQLTVISDKKQAQINAKSQELNERQKFAQNTMKECNELIENANVDKYERKKRILSMINDIISQRQQISQNVDDIATDIIFEFNTTSFLEDLAFVYDPEKQPIPLIVDIKCEPKGTECTVRWNAELGKTDLNTKIKSKLYMKILSENNEMDEKELESHYILFDQHNKNYQDKIKGLQHNVLYKMQISIYRKKQRDNDNFEKIKNCKPFLFNFKTLNYLDDKQHIIHQYQQNILNPLKNINKFNDIEKHQIYQEIKQYVAVSLMSISQFLNVCRSTFPDNILYQIGGEFLECVCKEIINQIMERIETADIGMNSAHNISLIIKYVATFEMLSNDLEYITRNMKTWKKFIKLGEILHTDQRLSALVVELNAGELNVFDKQTLIKLICALWDANSKRNKFIQAIQLKLDP